MVAPLPASKLANAAAASEPKALLIIRSVSGVTLTCPAVAAKPCRVTVPSLTCNMQGTAWPPESSREKVPSAPVVPDTGAPLVHLAVTLAPARAAPLAARPVIVGLAVGRALSPPPPPPPQEASVRV